MTELKSTIESNDNARKTREAEIKEEPIQVPIKEKENNWIGIFSLIVIIIGTFAELLIVPEIRELLGLNNHLSLDSIYSNNNVLFVIVVISIIILFILYYFFIFKAMIKNNNLRKIIRITIIICITTIVFFVGYSSGIISQQREKFILYRFQIIKEYNFEFDDSLSIFSIPYISQEKHQEQTISINSDPRYVHNGNHSLRLICSLNGSNDSFDFVDIMIQNVDVKNYNFIQAWIYFDPEPGITIDSITSYIYYQQGNEDNSTSAVFGQEIKLTPGKWNKLILGRVAITMVKQNSIYINGKINWFYIRIKSKAKYSGSIYIDDIDIYS